MPSTEANTAQLQELLARAEAEEAAYSELIARASDRLLRLTRRMLRNYGRLRRWEETEDVFQTAVMRLYRSLSDVRPSSVREFFGLAAAQIRRTLIDLARRHFGPEGAASHHHSDRLPPGMSPPERPDPFPMRPETLEAWTEFHEAVDQLEEQQKEVFHLVWYGGLPQSEAASLLSVSIPTIQRRWYAAQISLFKALHGESPLTEGPPR